MTKRAFNGFSLLDRVWGDRSEDAEELQNVATALLEESGDGEARNGGALDSPLCHFTR